MYASAWRAQCYKRFMLTSWKEFVYAQKLSEKMKKVVNFGSPRISKSKSNLKIFRALNGKNMYLINKRTSETSFITECWRMFHIRMFLLSASLASDCYDYIRFLVRLWLTYCSLVACLCEMLRSGEVNQFALVSQSGFI